MLVIVVTAVGLDVMTVVTGLVSTGFVVISVVLGTLAVVVTKVGWEETTVVTGLV